MVEDLSTSEGRVQNSAGVAVEGGSVDVDGNGLLGNGGHHEGRLVGRDVIVVHNLNASLVFGFVLASAIYHLVLPVVLEDQVDLVGLRPQIGGVGVTTVASVAARLILSLVAVGSLVLDTGHEHLLGEGKELASFDGVGSFERGSSSESPARSALSLVLHGSHLVVCSPVPGSGQVGAHFRLERLGSSAGTLVLLETEGRSPFGLSVIREEIVAESVAGVVVRLHLASDEGVLLVVLS